MKSNFAEEEKLDLHHVISLWKALSNGEDAMMNLTVNGFAEGRVSLLERGSCSTEWILSVQGNKGTCGNKITQHCVLGIGPLEE